ncbi:hypothetical protein DJ010_15805 [Nocardioides silvaticus]|uniref:Lipoprotein n=1 Tax=Nocardioides silvaticus TaxID=2201891 RepID=A0A316TFP8_9ACTN|nr:hypothetical protein [Nocardioides silvaticus]PWN01999.1 hypothetical protein DJ010_15805 [Nocardioides silvaticus]
MPTPRLAALLAASLLVVTACTDDGSDEPGGTTTDLSPLTSPTADATDVDHPAEGVDLVDPPTLEGVYQRALQTYVDFERGRRLAARTGKAGRLLSFNATADVVDPYRRALRTAPAAASYDGLVVVEFVDVQPRGRKLRLDLCVDATGLDVPDGAPAVLGEATRAPQQVDVSNIEGLWRVTRAEPVDGSC